MGSGGEGTLALSAAEIIWVSEFVVYVNGRRYAWWLSNERPPNSPPGLQNVPGLSVHSTLLDLLRRVLGLTGTKLGCGEGGCGACTVLITKYKAPAQTFESHAVNACLYPMLAAHGCAVTTVEGVGSTRHGLHPAQRALAEGFGSQCGFCTPGIVMSMYAMQQEASARGKKLSDHDVEHGFDGNLCRCTGYRPILDAFKRYASDIEDVQCAETTACGSCSNSCDSPCGHAVSRESRLRAAVRIDPVASESCRSELTAKSYENAHFVLHGSEWYRPIDLLSMSRSLGATDRDQSASWTMLVGNSELGIEFKARHHVQSRIICAADVSELLQISAETDGLRIGASVTWTALSEFIGECKEVESKMGNARAIQEQLQWFAGRQIRNVSAIAGNIVTASPISDMNPVWIAAGARFELLSLRSMRRRIVLARDFFLGYRKVDLSEPDDEILLSVVLPWTMDHEFVFPFKVSRRKEDDIAIVSSCIRFALQRDNSGWFFRDVSIAFGGLAARTLSAAETEHFLLSQGSLSRSVVEAAVKVLRDEIELVESVPGGMREYRESLAVGLFCKSIAGLLRAVFSKNDGFAADGILKSFQSFVALDYPDDKSLLCSRPLSEAVQICQAAPAQTTGTHGNVESATCSGVKAKAVVGNSIRHASAELQTTGEAEYVDDVPLIVGTQHGAFILSDRPHARILNADFSQVLACDGVLDVVTAKDVPGFNSIGQPPFFDELVFAIDKVTHVGQIVGLVVAQSKAQAVHAAKKAVISYEDLPAIIHLEEAVRQGSFCSYAPEQRIEQGDVDSVFAKTELAADHGDCGRGPIVALSGEVRIGGQEHFYLETNGSYVYPIDGGREVHMVVSTQAPGKTQAVVARVLGMPSHRVVCKTKRIGGGFGGKETRNFFMTSALAVAVDKLKVPIHLFLDRDVDMQISGQRHAMFAKYKVAFDTHSGRILALHVELFSNMGISLDLSLPVLGRALFHLDNTYHLENVRFIGKLCVTNTPSNTAFRGFGGPQGMMVTEQVIDHIALYLRKPAHEVRSVNLYSEQLCKAPFGMSVAADRIRACWDRVLESSEMPDRLSKIEAFNASHRTRKRGIAAIPTKFGISFTFRTFNQAAALVNIYLDGSVLVSHGGVEMGQGLHTKMIQVAATELRISAEKVFISETATDKVPNASPTAASASSDMYGMAIVDACAQLNARLAKYRAENEEDGDAWKSAVLAAWNERVNLSAQGFYRTPDLDAVDLSRNEKGNPFYYFTYGAAVSEVEIDTLTGEFCIVRADVVMDVGQALNPAIDIGQIEGGFVQGVGWCTMEELVRGSENAHAWFKSGNGTMLTQGPSTYKIPGFRDVPLDFRVELLPLTCEKPTVHSSKAVGEPPFFLGASAFFAIKNACYAARCANGYDDAFFLDSPASVERIRMACVDDIVELCLRAHNLDPVRYRPAIVL
ncbi:Xanthine dehydrogenase [Porphyridium purpureum]|uniref:Xanthine dehydrogenase n=1 Tax=Porphyridium purpureum TaxID=35688 RepID=A0A5J4Z4X1_PORPP|nr:Xanthine dehydrogenase [Porphyridium purpureum]|eukprot:POR9816..scf295_1